MLWREIALVLLATVLAMFFPRAGNDSFAELESSFSRLAARKLRSVFVIGAFALALRAAVLPLEPIPDPVVHDEFGYLLSAETFAHGRLTNPTHPMWRHFETFAEIEEPTYQCYAQPGQGMLLALGEVAFGHPFWGMWLSLGLMCAAITWMLQGWLSPQWALLGGFLSVLRFGVFGYWANSYWGGTMGAIGGALVLGALPRIMFSQKIRDALLFGLGVLILANSRPYEGFVLVALASIALVVRAMKTHRSFRAVLNRVVIPLFACAVLTFASVAYYSWRVTGNPLRTPYQVEIATYEAAPYMLWQSPRTPPVYNHAVLRKMYVDELEGAYRNAFSPFTFVAKLYWAWSFYLGPVLSLPLCMMAFILPVGMRWRDISPDSRLLISLFLCFSAAVAVETFFHPHYAAPATALVLALVLLAMRHLRAWSFHGKPSGLLLVRLIPFICVITFTLRAFAVPLHLPRYQFYAAAWHEWTLPSFGRDAIEHSLNEIPGRHLVIVRYQPQHDVFYEWVYNHADIDGSRIVWAREMTPAEDQELIKYFHDRQIWLLNADEKPPKLERYSVDYNAATPLADAKNK